MHLISELQAVLGAAHVLQGPDAAPYLRDWRGRFHRSALAVVRPGTTAEVAQVLRLCARHGTPVVPQGGNTGLVGGATPDASGLALVLLTTRLNRVREIDVDNDTITVEAGCILQTVQAQARAAGRMFPLSLAAEGSCTIGGNLASNAGGTAVLRYGNMRELTLGLEVVGPDGAVWDGLRGLRKDNTGLSLRDLYVGSEGTLGVITAAVLKLFPLPRARCTALLAVATVGQAVALLRRARAGFGPALTGFELMSGLCLQMVCTQFPQQRLPFTGASAASPWFALLEVSDAEGEQHARTGFERVLGEAFEAGEVQDVAIAESLAQSQAMWHLRESITLAQAEAGASIKHDVSLPISRIEAFIAHTDGLLQQQFAGLRNMTFGHLGDGNLHYNVGSSPQFDAAALHAHQDAIYALVHDSVCAMNGSISAEHGIGQLKASELAARKSPQELLLMQRIKQALDPQGLLNPGKMFMTAAAAAAARP